MSHPGPITPPETRAGFHQEVSMSRIPWTFTLAIVGLLAAGNALAPSAETKRSAAAGAAAESPRPKTTPTPAAPAAGPAADPAGAPGEGKSIPQQGGQTAHQ